MVCLNQTALTTQKQDQDQEKHKNTQNFLVRHGEGTLVVIFQGLAK